MSSKPPLTCTETDKICCFQVVGRKDTSTPAPDNLLPKAFGSGAAQQVLIQLFEDKGISQPELAALIGAHTASKAIAQEQYGVPFNGEWQVFCRGYVGN